MTLEPTTIVIASIALWHLIIGATLVIGIYWLMEYRLQASFLFGIVAITVLLLVESTLGEIIFDLTYPELRMFVQLAIASTLIGATVSSLTFEPNIQRS